MSGTTTTYAIEVLYKTRDQASTGLNKVGQSADRAAKSTGGLVSALRGVGTALVGFGAFRFGKSMFIDFNSSIEQSTISLAAQEKMLLGGKWDTAMSHASTLFTDYQKVAKESVGTTQDFISMHQGIAASAYRAGLGMNELKEMTIGATVAAVALGERADMVALDVKQMLSGDVTSRDRTAQILLASKGVSQEKFNKMKQGDRNKVITSALNDPALKSAARAYGQSFAGVTSTLKDNLQIGLGKVGLPLFKAITLEVQKWNDWIEKNPEKIRQWASDFTGGLMKGFEMVKSIAGFIVENKTLLMSLAKAYMVGKGVGVVTGSVTGMVGSLARLAGTGAGSFAALGVSLTSLTATVAVMAADYVDRTQTKQLDWTAEWGVLNRGAKEYEMGLGGSYMAGSHEDRVAEANGFYSRSAQAQAQGAAEANLLLAERVITQAKDAKFVTFDGAGRGTVDKTRIRSSLRDANPDAYKEDLDALAETYVKNLNKALGQQSEYLVGMSDGQRRAKFGGQYEEIKSAFAEGSRLWEGMTMRVFGQLVDPGFGSKMALIIARGYSMLPGMGKVPNVNNKDDAKNPGAGGKDHPIKVEVTVMTDDPDRFAVELSRIANDALKNPMGAKSVIREG